MCLQPIFDSDGPRTAIGMHAKASLCHFSLPSFRVSQIAARRGGARQNQYQRGTSSVLAGALLLYMVQALTHLPFLLPDTAGEASGFARYS